MNHKGFAAIGIIIAVLVVSGMLFWGVSRWQTYRNEGYGFSFKYPREIMINEGGGVIGDFVKALHDAQSKEAVLPLRLVLTEKDQVRMKDIIIFVERPVGSSLTSVHSPEELQKFEEENCRNKLRGAGRSLTPAQAAISSFFGDPKTEINVNGSPVSLCATPPLATPLVTHSGVFGGIAASQGDASRGVTVTFLQNGVLYRVMGSPQTEEKLLLDIAKSFEFTEPIAASPPPPVTPISESTPLPTLPGSSSAIPVTPPLPSSAKLPAPVSTAGWETYRDEEYFYEFKYPPDMTLRNVGPDNVLTFKNPPPKGLGSSMDINSSPFRNYQSIYGTESIDSLEEYYQWHIENCEKVNQQHEESYEEHRAEFEQKGIAKQPPTDCEKTTRGSLVPLLFVTNDGVQGEVYDQVYQGKRLASSAFFVANDTLYRASYTYNSWYPENAEREREVFFQIVKSIRFTAPTQGILFQGVILYGCGTVAPPAENCASSSTSDAGPKLLKIENTVSHEIQEVTTGPVPFLIKLNVGTYKICIGSTCITIPVKAGEYVPFPFPIPRP